MAYKVDINGNLLWSKGYQELTGLTGTIYDAVETNDGGFAFIALATAAGGELAIIRIDANGNYLWSTDARINSGGRHSRISNFNGTGLLASGIGSGGAKFVYLDNTGTITEMREISTISHPPTPLSIGGHVNAVQAGFDSLNVARIDDLGSQIWAKKLIASVGGVFQVDRTSEGLNGDFFITGMGAGGPHGFVIKMDSSGNVNWTKTYSIAGVAFWITNVVQKTDGTILIAGYIEGGGTPSKDIICIHADANGVPLWTKRYGGPHDETPAGLHLAGSGGIIFGQSDDALSNSAASLDAIYVIRFDQNGTTGSCFEQNVTVVDNNITLTSIPLTLTVSTGQENTIPMNFSQVNDSLPAEYPVMFATPSDTVIACGDSVQLAAHPTSNDITYSWSPAAGLSNNAIANPMAGPTSTTNYVLSMTYLGCTETSTANVTVIKESDFAYAVDSFDVDFTMLASGCANGGFTWDYGDGGQSTINPNPSHTYSSPGTYTVCLLCGGTPTGCATCEDLVIDGVSIFSDSTNSNAVGITEHQVKPFVVYPNPSQSEFKISNHKNEAWAVYSLAGQLVLSGSSDTIDLGSQTPGMYVLHIHSPEGVTVFRLMLTK